MGAVVAIAAARQRRIQEIVDAFRLADATGPERAKSLETIGLSQTGDLKDLVIEGVLMAGPREGTYYLSEAGIIYRRAGRRTLKVVVLVLVALLAIGMILIPVMRSRG
jgi:hypothetical protein